VVAAAISVVWAHGPERPLAAADAWRSSARGAALLSMLGVSLWLLPGLVPWRDTFVLALLGASALGLVGPIWTVLWRWQSRSRLRTALALGLLSFAGWYALSLAFPQWAGRLFAAKNELVSEQRAVTLGLLWRDLGPIPFLAPVALVIALGRRSGSDCERALVFTVTFAAIVGVLWIATHDYGYLASVLLTLNAAVTLAELTAADFPLWRRARRALETALGPRRGVAALGVAVFSLGALCLFTCTPPFLTRADASAMLIARPPWLDVARWISQRTPTPPSLLASAAPTTGDFQYPRGAYGVLSWWDFGNLISAEARRPVVASQRLSERVADFLLSDEKQGLDILKEGCRGDERVRYVIVDAQTLTEKFASIVGIARRSMDGFTEVSADGLPRYSARYEETLGVRLLERGGSTLGHFRLVHDTRDVAHTFYEGYVSADGAKLFDRRSVPAGPSTAPLDFDVALERAGVEPARPPYDRRLVPEIRVFEVVPGARLVGRAPPRARVHAIVTLEGDGVPRRAVGYSATAGPSGDFSVHVAHANGVTLSDTVRTAASYLLYLQQDEQQRLWSRPVVAEADVVDGRAVIVPAP
jgi:hypothetical protein